MKTNIKSLQQNGFSATGISDRGCRWSQKMNFRKKNKKSDCLGDEKKEMALAARAIKP